MSGADEPNIYRPYASSASYVSAWDWSDRNDLRDLHERQSVLGTSNLNLPVEGDSPDVADVVRSMSSALVIRYCSLLIAQPFDAAKTVMQCQTVPWNGQRFTDLDHDNDDGNTAGDNVRRVKF